MTTTQTRQYKDARFLTTMVLILLLALTGLDLVTALFTWLEIDLYTKFQNGGFATQEEGIAAETASDSRMILVSILRLGFFVVLGVCSLRWIARANSNAQSLGAKLTISPGWSVGYYFIPFLNLWKPYRAMCEIYQGSVSATRFLRVQIPFYLGLWWVLWVLAGMVNQASFRMTLNAKELEDALLASKVSLGGDFLNVLLNLAFFYLVWDISSLQRVAYENFLVHGPLEEDFGDQLDPDQDPDLVPE